MRITLAARLRSPSREVAGMILLHVLSFCSAIAQTATPFDGMGVNKLSPLLRETLEAGGLHDPLSVRVMYLSDPAGGPSAARLHEVRSLGEYWFATCVVDADRLNGLLAQANVVGIELIREPVPELRQEGLDLSLNEVLSLRDQEPGLNGEDATMSIKERAFDPEDVDFRNRILVTDRTPSRIDIHATSMASIAAGGGVSDATAQGVAWGARITSSDFTDLLPDPDDYFSAFDIHLQNHSYGTGIENYYGMETQAYDRQAVDVPELLHVFSSGNDGTSAPPDGMYAGISGYANLTGQFKQAKNILTVGGTDSLGVRLPYSSTGPAFDGRIKPELVAYGHGGTSGAAAIVSGIGILVQQAWEESRGSVPRAEVVRAILLHTARDRGRPGPDIEYGFGEVQAREAIDVARQGNVIEVPASSAPFTMDLDIPEGIRSLKLTLVWTDPPAQLLAGKALVHDLDLRLEQLATGTVHLPLVINPAPHVDSLRLPARPGTDTLNSIEQIVIDQPVSGSYRIHVDRSKTNGVAQAFTLVWSMDMEDDFQWTYPTGSDALPPGTRNVLRWSTSRSMPGHIELRRASMPQWQRILSDMDPQAFHGEWTATPEAEWAQLRWVTQDTAYLSDTFLVAPTPRLNVDLFCPDLVGLTWGNDSGADSFTVYRVGSTYLEARVTTVDTLYDDAAPDTDHLHYALAAWYDGRPGPRSPGYRADLQGADCYLDRFYFDGFEESLALFAADLSRPDSTQAAILQHRVASAWIDEDEVQPILETRVNLRSLPLPPGVHDFRLILRQFGGDSIISEPVRVWYVPDNDMLVYPNPVRPADALNVLVRQDQAYVLRIVDMAGRTWLDRESESYPETVPVSGLPAGIYVALVTYVDGTRLRELFQVVHP